MIGVSQKYVFPSIGKSYPVGCLSTYKYRSSSRSDGQKECSDPFDNIVAFISGWKSFYVTDICHSRRLHMGSCEIAPKCHHVGHNLHLSPFQHMHSINAILRKSLSLQRIHGGARSNDDDRELVPWVW